MVNVKTSNLKHFQWLNFKKQLFKKIISKVGYVTQFETIKTFLKLLYEMLKKINKIYYNLYFKVYYKSLKK